MDSKYAPLFTPWKIGNCEIKNRIVLTSMGGTDLFGWMEKNHFDRDGAKFILEYIRTDPEMMKTKVMEALEGHFRPEFLGRIDGKIIYHALTKDNLRKILPLQMKRIHKLLANRGITLEITKSAEDFLVEAGYKPAFGARPIKQAIIDYIQEPLSNLLIEHNYPEGTKIVVTAEEGASQLTYTV